MIVICVFFGCFGLCGLRRRDEGAPVPPPGERRWTQVPVKFLADQAGKTSPVNLSTRSFKPVPPPKSQSMKPLVEKDASAADMPAGFSPPPQKENKEVGVHRL